MIIELETRGTAIAFEIKVIVKHSFCNQGNCVNSSKVINSSAVEPLNFQMALPVLFENVCTGVYIFQVFIFPPCPPLNSL